MLNNNQILEAIDNKDIEVIYSFYPGSKNEQYIQPLEQESVADNKRARKFFEGMLVVDRVGVTIGRLVMPINKRKIRKNHKFRSHDIVDLDKTKDNGYIIEPGESVVVLSNEYYIFTEMHAAFIISRVSNCTNGLSVQTSYIDAGWNGTLELGITNHSSKNHKICIGQEIARVFFFKFSEQSRSDRSLIDSTLHYGKNWKTILANGYNPFIISATTDETDKESIFIRLWKLLKSTKFIFSALLIPVLMTGWTYFNSFKEVWENYSTYMKVPPKSYSYTMVLKKGDTSTSGKYVLSKEENVDGVVFLANNSLGNISYRVNSDEAGTFIEFTYEQDEKLSNSLNIEFDFIFIPK